MILDTNALSAFIDGDPNIGDIVIRGTRAAIPVIALGEFRYGIAQSRQRATYENWLEKYLPTFEVLSINDDTTLHYASIRVALKKTGQPIPANDAWIAALCFQHGLPVLSRDKHFDQVAQLRRIDW